jgi:hypothetical protein
MASETNTALTRASRGHVTDIKYGREVLNDARYRSFTFRLRHKENRDDSLDACNSGFKSTCLKSYLNIDGINRTYIHAKLCRLKHWAFLK